MTYEQVVKHYGSVRVAALALGYSTQAIYLWRENGIPLRTQRTIQWISCDKLKADKK